MSTRKPRTPGKTGPGKTGRGAPAKRTAASKRRAKTKQPGLLASLPMSSATLRRLGLWSAVSLTLVVGVATLAAFRVPQRIGTAIGEQVGAAGFTVSRVELRGLGKLDPTAVTKAALDQPSLAMPLLDLDAVRERLMGQFKWIKDARVSRRLPDTLVVDIVERTPAAVWQHGGRLTLVDIEGTEIELVRSNAIPAGLPVVIGPGAQHRIAPLTALLDAAPQLREHVAAATWVGGRRWDIHFKSEEVLSLPEDEPAALAAIRRFADVNERSAVLGRRFLRFDMRVDGRMIVQRRTAPAPGAAPASAPAATPAPAARAPAAQPPQELSRTI